jgi:hypothetical protein
MRRPSPALPQSKYYSSLRSPLSITLRYQAMLLTVPGTNKLDWFRFKHGLSVLNCVCTALLVSSSLVLAQETSFAPPSTLQSVPNIAARNTPPKPNVPSSSQAVANTAALTGSEANRVPSLENQSASKNVGANTVPTSPPSSAMSPALSQPVAPVRTNNVSLPTSAGQYWMEYDIRPYTQVLKSLDRPQQAIIDWILRDTGTDIWFAEPTGILTADRSTLRVYHNEAMHQVIKQSYERFVNGPVDPQAFSLRIITITNPNWRQRALAWMRSVEVDSPGVNGWLLSKENSAMLMSMLRSRNDVRETPLPELSIINGQSHNIDQLRSRNYVREYTRQEQPYPAYIPVNDEIQEGYRIQFSPLMSTDLRTMDVSLKCSIDQVERLNQVAVDLPSATGGVQSAQISVPQLVSWRLHERFRWPSDQVLVLSCGVIAAPTAANDSNSLISNTSGTSFFGLNKLLPNQSGARADAILVVEYKGPAASQLSTGNNPPSNTAQSISRGRY